ncbi:MAG TPA: putative cytokinetic ring protein SteA [Solirubrobacteraceae bacterium]|nr:putative cytokinetic ring protein SteA [Solirubrobacteraceae bacterium]
MAVQSPPVRSIRGVARLGKRTKTLVKRLKPGDVAVIDHENLDRVSAEDLIASGVKVVVNAARSSSDRYPNMGPLLLVQAGVLLVDAPGAPLFDKLKDGDAITVHGGQIRRGDDLVATGEVQAPEALRRLNDERRREIGEALEAFARNTVEHMLEERELLVGKLELPRFDTEFRDRPTLIVVRGVDHRRDLRALRPYIRDLKPVIVAVDGGADALVQHGFKADMIVGDMDSVSDRTLRMGAELVVHAYPDGRAPGRERVQELGLPHKIVPAPGTSQDIAMLIAAEKGARLIVSVGSQYNLVEFLDKNRRGMSSTFLTRLRVGEILVDAKGVSRLYRPRPGLKPILALFVVGVIAFVAIVALTPGLRDVADLLWLKLQVLLGIGA